MTTQQLVEIFNQLTFSQIMSMSWYMALTLWPLYVVSIVGLGCLILIDYMSGNYGENEKGDD